MTNVEEFQDYHVVDDNLDTATETESVQSVASSGGKRKNSCDDQVSLLKQRVFQAQVERGTNLAITLF